MNADIAKTKILVTLGPSTDSKEKLAAIVDAGVDALRLNFSHGDYQYFEKVFETINEVCVSKSLPIPILMDLQGPKIRVGELESPEVELITGDEIEITTENVIGNAKKISTSYQLLAEDADIGDKILIDDGLLMLEVVAKKENGVVCEIRAGGTLKPKKGMNLPGMKLSTPSITDKDFSDIDFGLKHRIDFIALSFVRRAADIIALKNYLVSKGKDIPVIAKIEKPEAVENFEEILMAADGIMVARGDLGVEMKPQEVPIIQKSIIRKCKEVGKLVITATQMLESMINNPVPTRAEASDVANAVIDGTDVVMLSGETSVGKYPVRAVKVMNDILINTENHANLTGPIKFDIPENFIDNIFDATGKAIATVAEQINAALIVVFSENGRQASVISKFRPKTKIVALSKKFDVLNRLNMYYGIIPYFMDTTPDEDDCIKKALVLLKEKELTKPGDLILLTSGEPGTGDQSRQWMRFVTVK